MISNRRRKTGKQVYSFSQLCKLAEEYIKEGKPLSKIRKEHNIENWTTFLQIVALLSKIYAIYLAGTTHYLNISRLSPMLSSFRADLQNLKQIQNDCWNEIKFRLDVVNYEYKYMTELGAEAYIYQDQQKIELEEKISHIWEKDVRYLNLKGIFASEEQRLNNILIKQINTEIANIEAEIKNCNAEYMSVLLNIL